MMPAGLLLLALVPMTMANVDVQINVDVNEGGGMIPGPGPDFPQGPDSPQGTDFPQGPTYPPTYPPFPDPDPVGPTANCTPCGVENSDSKIVGGQEVTPNQFPWLVGLASSEDGIPWCGGSLFSDSWVITAAHCVNSANAAEVFVKLGMYDMAQTAVIPINASVSDIIVHPAYDEDTLHNDIALLKLADSVEFSDAIQPVCLPPQGAEYPNWYSQAEATGWGTTTSGGYQPQVNHWVALEIRTPEECYQALTNSFDQDLMICAGFPEGGKDTCQGDSGGPLTVFDAENHHVLVGITSRFTFCTYGVYAKVSEYVDDFILANTGTCDAPKAAGGKIPKGEASDDEEKDAKTGDKEPRRARPAHKGPK